MVIGREGAEVLEKVKNSDAGRITIIGIGIGICGRSCGLDGYDAASGAPPSNGLDKSRRGATERGNDCCAAAADAFRFAVSANFRIGIGRNATTAASCCVSCSKAGPLGSEFLPRKA